MISSLTIAAVTLWSHSLTYVWKRWWQHLYFAYTTIGSVCVVLAWLFIAVLSFPMSCLLAFYLLLSAKWRMNGLFVEVFGWLSDDCDEPHSPLWSGWPVCPISWLSEWESNSSTSLGGVVRGNSLIWSSLYRLSFLQHETGLRGAHSFTHSADLSITVGKPHSRWSGWLILITE